MLTIWLMMKYRLAILAIMLIFHDMVLGKDFGIIGQTFRVVEESFIAMLKKRLEKIDIAKVQEQIQIRAKERVNNPIPVIGISQATKDRIFYFDPTYTLEKDAVLPCGTILYKAGTRVNPLKHMDLNRRLFFIDARRVEQVTWLKKRLNSSLLKQNKKEQIEDRVILVGGSVLKLQEELGDSHADKVYFDQAGELTTKFGIKASPAVVVQEGSKLKVQEIKI